MFPLVTNRWDLPLKAILQAYKFQPKLEKRHEQLKSVQEVTPVWLKNVSRVEGLLLLYFVALLVQALLERELRQAMARKGIKSLPLYPEERECKAPSAERVFDLFAPLSRHRLRRASRVVKVFEPQLSRLQSKILSLLRIRPAAYESRE
jgi:transposase